MTRFDENTSSRLSKCFVQRSSVCLSSGILQKFVRFAPRRPLPFGAGRFLGALFLPGVARFTFFPAPVRFPVRVFFAFFLLAALLLLPPFFPAFDRWVVRGLLLLRQHPLFPRFALGLAFARRV